jgi:hypothetical protein
VKNAAANKPKVLVSGVCERDIDLLLLGECVANPKFVQWLVATIGLDEALGSVLVRAERSATLSNGESDLELLLEHPSTGDKYMLMLENKIAAGFQPQQAERYVFRGQGHVLRRECTAFRSVLIAPQKYLGKDASTKGFNKVITYEAILGWCAAAYRGQTRLRYLSRMLEAAIEKSTYGYQPLEDKPVTAFWHRYWLLSCQIAPELEFQEPAGKPAKSSFLYFQPYELPKGVRLCHKVTRGNVDLQFAGLGERTNQLRKKLEGFLEKKMEVVKIEKSAAVRLHVTRMDINSELERNVELMTTGILAAKHLLAWYIALPRDIQSDVLQSTTAVKKQRSNKRFK